MAGLTDRVISIDTILRAEQIAIEEAESAAEAITVAEQISGLDGRVLMIESNMANFHEEVTGLAGDAVKAAEGLGGATARAIEAADAAGRLAKEAKEDSENEVGRIAGLFDKLKGEGIKAAVASALGGMAIPGGAVAIAVALGLWFIIKRDIRNLLVNGDPLIISKIAGFVAEKTPWEWDDRLVSRLDAPVQAVAARVFPQYQPQPGPQPMPLAQSPAPQAPQTVVLP
jgi:hypothetical protein